MKRLYDYLIQPILDFLSFMLWSHYDVYKQDDRLELYIVFYHLLRNDEFKFRVPYPDAWVYNHSNIFRRYQMKYRYLQEYKQKT